MNEELLRPSEARAILNVGRSTMYNLIKSGEIKSVNVSHMLRIKRSDLEQYIEAGRKK